MELKQSPQQARETHISISALQNSTCIDFLPLFSKRELSKTIFQSLPQFARFSFPPSSFCLPARSPGVIIYSFLTTIASSFTPLLATNENIVNQELLSLFFQRYYDRSAGLKLKAE